MKIVINFQNTFFFLLSFLNIFLGDFFSFFSVQYSGTPLLRAYCSLGKYFYAVQPVLWEYRVSFKDSPRKLIFRLYHSWPDEWVQEGRRQHIVLRTATSCQQPSASPNRHSAAAGRHYLWAGGRAGLINSRLKQNSWMYSFVEVSGHHFESSQTWGFCMDFLNHREGSMIFHPFFFTEYSNWIVKWLRKFEEYKS